MTTSNHTVTVTINGVDRTALLRKDSLYIRASVSNDGDTATFTLYDDGTYTPNGWHSVTIAVNSVDVFGGYIVTKRARDVGVGSGKAALWSVTCRDWSVLFDQVVVNAGYADTDDTGIIAGLFADYLGSDGFDAATYVANVKDDIDIYFDSVTLRQALDQLASVCGADWHVAPDKSIYWYDPSSPSAAAFDIDTVSPDNATTFDVLAGSIEFDVDESSIINSATIIGGERLLNLASDSFTTTSGKTHYTLTRKLHTLGTVTYTINGTAYYAHPEDIGIEPGDSLAFAGGDYDVLLNLENRYITIKDVDGNTPDVGGTVTVSYYPSETVVGTAASTPSQGEYGRVFEYTAYDDKLTSASLATDVAQRVINEYEYGRETIAFSVTEHGLLPGRLITVNVPVLSVEETTLDRIEKENREYLLQEQDDFLLLESAGAARTFLIQEVEIYPTVTQQDEFLIVAKVRAGKYTPTLYDTLKQVPGSSAAPGLLPARRNIGKLDQMSADLGEVRAGRAVFTDGGTAPFAWDDYAGHTGAVVGLEGADADAYGAMYILQDGNVRAKVGRLDGLGTVGTVAPSGWGIWTDNGYFTGALNATTGEIGGWVIANNAIYADGGTISTSVPPINSSNPGVYMTSAGLYGYGTLGLTFALPSDPAQRPIFSSGTILETVYEVTNAAVIRTGTTFPKVQIDNSGIFAYNGAGSALFTVDSNTGRMAAVDGIFSGSVTASSFTGGTITGGTINGAVVQSGTGFPKVAINSTGIFGYDGAANPKFYVNSVTGRMTAVDGTFSGTVSASLFTGGTVSAVSGSVRIDDDGISLATAGSSPLYGDQRFISYFDPGSESVVAAIGGIAGSSTNRGTVMVHAYDRGATAKYSELLMTPDIVRFALYSAPTYTSVMSATTSYVQFARNIEPSADGTFSNGRSGARWLDVWAVNGTIQTSDERKKREIADSALGLEFVKRLRAISWLWRDIDDGRRHHGLSAQAVRAVLDELGAGDFAGHLYDAESDVHSLQYSEFIAPLIAAIQELAQRVESLEEQWQTAR